MGMDLQPERRLPERVTTTLVKSKARAGDCRAGRRVDRRDDRTNRNGQRGQARAMSVLGNTKSDRHRKARGVESGGAARESMHLTRGDLPVERRAEVSRGRSSEEGRESGWSEGPKAQRDRLAAGLRVARPAPGRPSTRWPRKRSRRWMPVVEPTGGDREARAEGCSESATGSPDRMSWTRCGEVHLRQPPDARKPHVRWCGRGDGRNPVTPTRSKPRECWGRRRGRACPVPRRTPVLPRATTRVAPTGLPIPSSTATARIRGSRRWARRGQQRRRRGWPSRRAESSCRT